VASEPIQERILQDLEASLRLVNGTGAYHHVLVTILERGAPWPEALDQLPAARVLEGDEAATLGATGLVARQLPVTVEARLALPEPGRNLRTEAGRLIADLERAVTADPRRGGLAVDTFLTGNSRLIDEEPGPLAEVRVEFLVQYRTRHGDPATAG
jgi:hypothetical protein